MRITRSLLVGLTAVALGLSACGGSESTDVTTGGTPTDEQPDETVSPDESSPEEEAATWLGLTREEAEARAQEEDRLFRIGREGDEHFMLTEDLRPGRITVGLDRAADGETWVVTEATLETEEGEVTVGEAASSEDTGSAAPAEEDPDSPTTSGPVDQSDDPSADEPATSDDATTGWAGLTEEEAVARAEAEDRPWRVGRRGDEQYMLTEDYVIGRVTFELDEQDGTWVVTKAVTETEDGPVTDE